MRNRIFYSGMLVLGLCYSCATVAVAQKTAPYQLKGYMGIQGGESFHYDLELYDSTGNFLSGYALTASDGDHWVKATVVAQKDTDRKTLRITEKQIIENHHFKSRAVICLVDAELQYDTTENKLTGPIITQTIGQGGTCSKGSISLINSPDLRTLFSDRQPTYPSPKQATPTPAVATAGQPTPTRQPVNHRVTTRKLPDTKPPAPAAPREITAGKDGSYEWRSDTVRLHIRDGNNEDNDRVTILYNGQIVLENYRLTNSPKTLDLPLGGNELNIIAVLALNEGNTPPNTANITLLDGETRYEVVAHNKITKKAIIKIRKASR